MAGKKKQNATAASKTNATAAAGTAQDAGSLLKADHRKVEGLFTQYENAQGSDDKEKLAKQICKELIVHTKIEEELFYPACREKEVQDDSLDEAQVEHDGAKVMIAELIAGDPDDDFYDAKMKVLSEYIKHHVKEEEKPRDGIIAKAQSSGVDMSALGQKLQQRKQQLMGQLEENDLDPPQPRSLDVENLEAGGYYEERGERGRTMSGDGRGSRGEYVSRGRDDDYDRRGGYRGSGNYRERDEDGRFMSGDDRGRGGYSSRGRDDDARYSGRGRSSSRGDSHGGEGHGGWFGDSRGHSEASREGWENRDSSRSRNDGDDRRSSRGGSSGGSSRGGYSSRSHDDDDDDDRRGSRSGERHGGWFGDSRGHSEAARRGWRDRD